MGLLVMDESGLGSGSVVSLLAGLASMQQFGFECSAHPYSIKTRSDI